MISNDFIIKINSKTLLIIKRMINLNVDINKNEEIAILSLSVLNDYFITNFKSNEFKTITISDEILFKIKMKLNKSSIFFDDNCISLLTLLLWNYKKKKKILIFDILNESTFITINVNLFLNDNNAQFEKNEFEKNVIDSINIKNNNYFTAI